ncbi:MAG: flagellar biosynthetic protein FliO [Melioribacteraceae bacterium]|nr:flagellar biosynthetic protein FliO [Melioribacteraceae bacterium]
MSAWDIVQIFLILAVMMGIMYAILYFVKKYMYSFDNKNKSNSKISIISTQTILPKKYVSVIEFNNFTYLIGVSDQSVNLIDKFNSENIVNQVSETENSDRTNFLKLLKSNMGIK